MNNVRCPFDHAGRTDPARRAEDASALCVFVEAFDEPWKGLPELMESEKHGA